MPALPKATLAQHVLDALGDLVTNHGDVNDVPFMVEVKGLLPLAIFAFTVSDPPGGRPFNELKIQLIAPGQKKGQTGNFKAPDDDSYAILLGYSQDYEVFVLWDAYKHRDFGWSKNCQIRIDPMKDAQIGGLGYRERRLTSIQETERIIVARPDHLKDALGERIRTSD